MTQFKRIALSAAVLLLVGQGCLGSGGSSGADGALWATDDVGKNWVQLAALPQPSGVSSIAGVNVTSIEIDPSDHSVLYMGTQSNGLFYSIDNGQAWQRPENGEAKTGAVLDVEVNPEGVCTVWALKPQSILKTQDCARTFEEVYTESRDDEVLTDFVLDWFNENILYAGTSAGDVLKSIDGGRSWANIYNVKDEISSITVSNKDSRIILVGTEDKGLFRSTDGGSSWQELEDELNREFRKSDEVYGFTQTRDGSIVIMNTEFGLLVSDDVGATWSEVPILTNDVRIWSVAVDPQDGDTIYYGVEGTFYASNSGGAAWSTEDMPSRRAPRAMVVHPSETDIVFAGFASVEN